MRCQRTDSEGGDSGSCGCASAQHRLRDSASTQFRAHVGRVLLRSVDDSSRLDRKKKHVIKARSQEGVHRWGERKLGTIEVEGENRICKNLGLLRHGSE